MVVCGGKAGGSYLGMGAIRCVLKFHQTAQDRELAKWNADGPLHLLCSPQLLDFKKKKRLSNSVLIFVFKKLKSTT